MQTLFYKAISWANSFIGNVEKYVYFLTGKTLEKDEKVGLKFYVYFVWEGLKIL